MPKFKCAFKVTLTVEKTFMIDNYEVDIPDEACRDAYNLPSKTAVMDSISDEICDSINQGDFDPEEEGRLIDTDYNNDSPTFVIEPLKVNE